MRDTTTRIESLDAFRGLAVAGMILVSTPGSWSSVYPSLDHAIWNGWTLTDLVFPFFLFAMGAAVPLAHDRRKTALKQLSPHVFRRTLLLFGLGLVLNTIETPGPLALATFRIPGVLQRIAVVYAMVALATETLSDRQQTALVTTVLGVYWAAMMWVPVPGVGAGVLTPNGNLASYVDRQIFGRHMLTPAFDPEGLLSTFPAFATAMLGVFAGRSLQRSEGGGRTFRLWVGGAALTIAGLAWGRVFPINKTLWTSSFALFTAGLAAQTLAVFHWLFDVKGWRAPGRPLLAFGRNALAAYFLSVGLDSVLTRTALAGSTIKNIAYRAAFWSWLRPCCGDNAASLGYAVAYVAIWAVVLAEMRRRQIFISI
ncbi:MAG TPA: heparan-alpha-glucosaminide N-acetyltransferase domain-containing protein [Vicinamibacterales bacterium]